MLDVASPQLYGLWAAIAACSRAASFFTAPGLARERRSGSRDCREAVSRRFGRNQQRCLALLPLEAEMA